MNVTGEIVIKALKLHSSRAVHKQDIVKKSHSRKVKATNCLLMLDCGQAQSSFLVTVLRTIQWREYYSVYSDPYYSSENRT